MYSLPAYDAADIALPPGGYMLPNPAAADLVYGADAPGAAGFISGAFGNPAAGSQLTAAAGSVHSTAFGAPFATTFTPIVIHRIGAAGSVHSTAFGPPSVRTAATGEASAAGPSVAFGAALAGVTQHAQPVAPTAAFGTPAAGATAHADGFRSPSFGTPAAGLVQSAGSFYRETLWGVPSAATHSTHSAEPAAIGAQFGAHIASCAYRALHLAPATRFGKPLMQRGNLC